MAGDCYLHLSTQWYTIWDRGWGDDDWHAVRILDEGFGKKGRLEYLVEWDGVDPATGERYAASWEPRNNCTRDLKRDWKAGSVVVATPCQQLFRWSMASTSDRSPRSC